jgi:curli biogenesis system outer membrane secretion channel CsgG
MMKSPEWLKPAVWGGIVGAAIIAAVGFSAGWVVTSGSAKELAAKQEEKAVLAALTPICVAQFKTQTSETRTTQLAALKGESSWQQGDYVEKQGWATMPGSKEPSDEVADACATELLKLAK